MCVLLSELVLVVCCWSIDNNMFVDSSIKLRIECVRMINCMRTLSLLAGSDRYVDR